MTTRWGLSLKAAQYSSGFGLLLLALLAQGFLIAPHASAERDGFLGRFRNNGESFLDLDQLARVDLLHGGRATDLIEGTLYRVLYLLELRTKRSGWVDGHVSLRIREDQAGNGCAYEGEPSREQSAELALFVDLHRTR